MGKIIKTGDLDSKKFENKCCPQRPAMSWALPRPPGEGEEGWASHTRSMPRAVLGFTRFLHSHTILGYYTTIPTLWMSQLRLREARLLALDIYRISKEFEPRSASLKKENKQNKAKKGKKLSKTVVSGKSFGVEFTRNGRGTNGTACKL